MTSPLPRERWLEEMLRHLDMDRELVQSEDPLALSQAERAHYLLRTMPGCLAPRRIRRHASERRKG